MQSIKNAKTEVKTIVQDCTDRPAHLEKIEYLISTLAKFTLGISNLEVVLGSQRWVINKHGINYSAKSEKVNSKKFSDFSKPSSVTCFYCNTIGHISNTCYYKKDGIPKEKFKWIPKKLTQTTNSKGFKFIWVPASKPYESFAGK